MVCFPDQYIDHQQHRMFQKLDHFRYPIVGFNTIRPVLRGTIGQQDTAVFRGTTGQQDTAVLRGTTGQQDTAVLRGTTGQQDELMLTGTISHTWILKILKCE